MACVSIKIVTVAALIGISTTLNTLTEAFQKQVVNCAAREFVTQGVCLASYARDCSIQERNTQRRFSPISLYAAEFLN